MTLSGFLFFALPKKVTSIFPNNPILAKQLPRFLKVDEVASLLRCKKRTIYDMVEQKRIPHRKVGGRLLFDLDEIVDWTKRKP